MDLTRKCQRKRTGILVSNGYIIEYDILRHKITEEIYTVCWKETTKKFYLIDMKKTLRHMSFVINAPHNYEIIGNRIDNPELLRGAEDDTEV